MVKTTVFVFGALLSNFKAVTNGYFYAHICEEAFRCQRHNQRQENGQ
jgi:hypothetical protein